MSQIDIVVKDKVKVALGGGRPLAVNDVQVSTLVMNINTLRQQRQAIQASNANTISEVPVSEPVAPTMETPVIPDVAPVMPEETPMTNETPFTEAPAIETPASPVQESVNMEMPTSETQVAPDVAPVMPEAAPMTNEVPVTEAPAIETPVTPVQESVNMEMPTSETPVIPDVAPVMPEETPMTNETPVTEAPAMETPVTPVQESVNMEMPVGVEITEEENNSVLKELENIHEKYNQLRKHIDEEEKKEVSEFFQKRSEKVTQDISENVIPFPDMNTEAGTSPVQRDAMTLGLEKTA